MTERELKIFFTSSYQYSQAISYLVEMMKEDCSINIYFAKDVFNILKLQVLSQPISKKTCCCFIEYNPNIIGVFVIKKLIVC